MPSLLFLEFLCALHGAQRGLLVIIATTLHLAVHEKVWICPRIEYVTPLSLLGRGQLCGGKMPFVFPPKLLCHQSIGPYHAYSLPSTHSFGSYQRFAIITPEYKGAIPIFRPELRHRQGNSKQEMCRNSGWLAPGYRFRGWPIQGSVENAQADVLLTPVVNASFVCSKVSCLLIQSQLRCLLFLKPDSMQARL